MDRKLALPDFLKLLTSNKVSVHKAMATASKVFKEHNTPALLAQLDDTKLQALDIKDKDLRRLVLAAVRRAGYKTEPTRELDLERDGAVQSAAGPSCSNTAGTVHTPFARKKKRYRDDDVSEFSPAAPPDDESARGNMDFNDVLDEEILRVKSTVVNRAPLLTAWATIVAERLGFEREEALSIGSVYTEMNAVAKGLSLGIIDQRRKTAAEPVSDAQQPYVDLMGRRPLYRTQLTKWRALASGSPAPPGAAFSYISRAFRQTTPHIVGALRLLAESYSPQELNKVGFSLYADFRPTVEGWGKRGQVRCERILSLRKRGAGDPSGTDCQHDKEETTPEQVAAGESPRKKARLFSLDE